MGCNTDLQRKTGKAMWYKRVAAMNEAVVIEKRLPPTLGSHKCYQSIRLMLWVGIGTKRGRSMCADCYRDRVTLMSLGFFLKQWVSKEECMV